MDETCISSKNFSSGIQLGVNFVAVIEIVRQGGIHVGRRKLRNLETVSSGLAEAHARDNIVYPNRCPAFRLPSQIPGLISMCARCWHWRHTFILLVRV